MYTDYIDQIGQKEKKVIELELMTDKADPKKVDRILNSAFEEFGLNGFEKASTNKIVKNAGVSKGLLFHYFGSKQYLYDYLVAFTFEKTTELLSANIDWEEGDLLNRLKQIFFLKLSIVREYPCFYKFIKRVIPDRNIAGLQGTIYEDMTELVHKIYSYQIDYSLFREDINVNHAIEIIHWTFEKFAEEKWKNCAEEVDMYQFAREAESFRHTLKAVFYKQTTP